jgi:hypothetical protein
MDLLGALFVLDRVEGLQVAGCDAGLFNRFAAGGRFQRFAGIGDAFGDAPGLATVVVTGGMHEQHLDAAVGVPIEQCSGGLFGHGEDIAVVLDDIRSAVLGALFAAYLISRVVRFINGARVALLYKLGRVETAIAFVVVSFVYATAAFEVPQIVLRVFLIIGAGAFALTAVHTLVRGTANSDSGEDPNKSCNRDGGE